MSAYNRGNNDNTKTYYDILEVPVQADAATIRKSYLKKSLKYHPDKNPNNPQEAKAKFVEIGEAYETLSDPDKRRRYDNELRSGRKTNFFTKPDVSDDRVYENYADAFDATVAGMSEAELAAAIGTVSALAGIVGSVIGSRVLGGGHSSRGGSAARTSLLGTAGSMVGGIVASELASSSLRALHQDSINRLNYKEECRRAVERGEPMPERPQTSSIGNQIGNFVKNTIDSVTGMATDTKIDDKNDSGSFNNSNPNNKGAKSERDSANDFGKMWKMAAAGLKAAQQAAAAQPTSKT